MGMERDREREKDRKSEREMMEGGKVLISGMKRLLITD